MKTLKTHLILNAAFSGFSGLLLTFFPEYFSSLFFIEDTLVFTITGLGLMLFSFYVFLIALKFLNNKKLVNSISLLDVSWVIASFSIILFRMFHISFIGNLIIGIIAIWISYLAFMQIKLNQ